LYTQAVFILTCCFFLRWWGVIPGVAIAFVALAACIMAVRTDSFSSAEKAIWVAITLALVA
jgi:hypothetical protein